MIYAACWKTCANLNFEMEGDEIRGQPLNSGPSVHRISDCHLQAAAARILRRVKKLEVVLEFFGGRTVTSFSADTAASASVSRGRASKNRSHCGHRPWQIGIFVKSITPARLPPHLECLRYYFYTLHAFYVLSFVGTGLWRSQGESC